LHFGAQSNARPHLRNRLGGAGIIRPAIIGRHQGQAEALREASFGQKAPRAVGVKARYGHIGVVGKGTGRQPLAGGLGGAFHDAFSKSIAVYRHGKRAAHAHIMEGVAREGLAFIIADQHRVFCAGIVKPKIDQAQPLDFIKRNALIAPQAFQVG